MIPVQRGRGGWVNSRTTLAKAMAIVGVAVMLAMARCSSKKPAPVGDTNPNPNQLNENGTNGSNSSLEDWEKGLIPGKGGPLSDIHFGYNDSTIQDQDGSVLKIQRELAPGASADQGPGRGLLRRARQRGIQYRAGRQARAGRQGLPGDARNQREQNVHDQLRQGASGLPGPRRKLLGAKPARSFFGEQNTVSDKD